MDTLTFTFGGLVLLLVLIIAAIYLARHDKVTRVKLGIFFEREREKEEEEAPSEPETKILGHWPGERKEKQ